MNEIAVKDKFKKIGANLKIENNAPTRWNDRNFSIDIKNEEFVIDQLQSDIDVQILQSDPKIRHLLLMVKDADKPDYKAKYLCGHDERHWFVAAIPEAAHAKNISDAMRALKPDFILEKQKGSRKKSLNRRKNNVYIRQGEWFFIPQPNIQVPEIEILKNEILTRDTKSKPHICQELYRRGGELVWIGNKKILSQEEFLAMPDKERRKAWWTQQLRDPEVYVRGKVTHSDHKTITLDGWHRVYMNKENESLAMNTMQFID